MIRSGKHNPWKTTLTEETIKLLCDNIMTGIKPRQSGAYLGISPKLVDSWITKAHRDLADNKTDSIYYKLGIAINKANTDYAKARLQNIISQEGNTGGWQASKWLLEVHDPENYRPDSVTVNLKNDDVTEDQLDKLTSEELQTLLVLKEKMSVEQKAKE